MTMGKLCSRWHPLNYLLTGTSILRYSVNDPCPGSLQITWQDIMVGVESGLLMFPINILIITIFRSIKPRIVSKAPKNSSEDKVRPRLVTITTILKVGLKIGTLCFTLHGLITDLVKSLCQSCCEKGALYIRYSQLGHVSSLF